MNSNRDGVFSYQPPCGNPIEVVEIEYYDAALAREAVLREELTGCEVAELEQRFSVKPMDTAPKDGTRILIKVRIYLFDHRAREYVGSGTKWVECWFRNGIWREWCGNKHTRNTAGVGPLGWMELPNE